MSSRFYCACVPLQVPSSPISKTAILASVAAFAVMTSGPSTGRNGLRCKAAGGPWPLAVTRFVCAHCTATGELSSSQQGLRPAPHRRIASLPRCETGRPGDPSRGPGRRRHGRSRGRGGPRAGRPTSASRYVSPEIPNLEIYNITTIH